MKNFYLLSICCLVCLPLFGQKKKYQSFIPGEVWTDNNGVAINAHGGGLLYHSKTYYWFGEHKIEGKAGNQARVGVHCYSSKDLYNWKDEGIALPVATEGSGSDIEKGCILERPKVIYNAKTKKFVMWFHLELKEKGYSAARAGVAVSDKVTGPYTFLYSSRVNARVLPVNAPDTIAASEKNDPIQFFKRDFNGGQMARDMTLFVDDDGSAYHIYASEENQTLQIAQLTDDYLKHSGKYMRVFIGRSMEAPTLFKHNRKYYFIGSGCTGWAPNAARSAMASSIWGPWTELGNPCVGDKADITFDSQSTYVLKVQGKKDTYIFMADRWRPDNAIDGRYIWLPIKFEDAKPVLHMMNEWQMEKK